MHVMVKFMLPNKHYQGLFFDSSSIILIILLLEQFLVGPTSNLPNNPWMQIRSWEHSQAWADYQLGDKGCFHCSLFTQNQPLLTFVVLCQRISWEIFAQQNCYYFHLILPTVFCLSKIYWGVCISLSKCPCLVSLGCVWCLLKEYLNDSNK